MHPQLGDILIEYNMLLSSVAVDDPPPDSTENPSTQSKLDHMSNVP